MRDWGAMVRRRLRGAAPAAAYPPPDRLPALPPVTWLRSLTGETDLAGVAAGLLAIARDGDPALRSAALGALGAAPACWWPPVDVALRRQWTLAPALSSNLATDPLTQVLAACHRDGRIREAAITRLAGRPDPAVSAVLALRSADWVPQVRDRARAAVLPPAYLPRLAEMAFLLRHRHDGGWLADRVDDLLQELPAAALEPLLSARDRLTRRAAYRAATERGLLDLPRLARAAVTEDDLPIRTLVTLAAIRAATGPDDLRGLLTNRSALVRAEALRVSGPDAARAALLDRNARVRAVAQDVLRRAGLDPAAVYRRAPMSPESLAGLGETGDPGDAALARPGLVHPLPRGRVEAVRALRRLGAARPADLTPLLRDESRAVTRQVVRVLRPDAGTLDPEMLAALLEPANPPHVRSAGFRLLIGQDVWRRLTTDLRLLGDPDRPLARAALSDLVEWLDWEAATTYRPPSPAQAATLTALVEQAAPVLGADRVRQLRFHAGLPGS